jgi:hypothetical protein
LSPLAASMVSSRASLHGQRKDDQFLMRRPS